MRTKEQTPRPYATGTEVSEERTQGEIQRLLIKHGATEFGSGFSGERAFVGFRLEQRLIRMTLVLPEPDEFKYDQRGYYVRSEKAREDRCQAERRRRWRALLLVLKAKLEAVASGVVSLEEEFLSYVVLPSGQTVGEWYTPQIAHLAERGLAPPLLPGLPPARGDTDE